jgi:hypothetical protein
MDTRVYWLLRRRPLRRRLVLPMRRRVLLVLILMLRAPLVIRKRTHE